MVQDGQADVIGADHGIAIRNNRYMDLLDERDVTPREREIIGLLRARLTNIEIADRLYISVRTVESHVSSLLTKLGADDRLDLAALAEQLERSRPLHNLPRPPASFVGRQSELVELEKLIRGSRLVTVVGSAGVGKTRLTLEAANICLNDYSEGVWLVELAQLDSSNLVAPELMRVLGCPSNPHLSPIEALVRYAESMSCLLILDNCEHVVEGVASTTEALLNHTRSVRVIATSRQALGFTSEAVMALAPLALPQGEATRDALLQSDAVRLFATRAEATRRGFRVTEANARHVAAICRHLDGLPLGLELAASRLRSFSPAQLAERLDDRLGILAAPRPEARHRTLEAAIAWSYDLLSSDEQLLLLRLSVFAGSFSLATAEEACSDDRLPRRRVLELLPSLVEKSLVDTDPSGDGYRYRLLESIRWFARERLEGRDELMGRLTSHLMKLAEQAETELRGVSQREWLDQLRKELPNIRVALEWAIKAGEAEMALRSVAALELFWSYGDLRREGIDWVKRILDAFPDGPDLPRLRVMLSGAHLLEPWDTRQAIRLAEQALELARAEGEMWEMRARLALGYALVYDRPRAEETRQNLEMANSYFETIGDRWRQGLALFQLGNLHHVTEAIGYLEAAAECFAQAEDRVQYGNVRYLGAAKLLRFEGADLDQVFSWAEEALNIADELGSRQEQAHAKSLQALMGFRRDDFDQATALCHQCLGTFRQVSDTRCTARMLSLKGFLAAHRGDFAHASGCFREAMTEALRANDMATVAECSDGLGAMADGMEAVRWHAAAQTQRTMAGVAVNASGIDYENRLAELRNELGEETFTIAWEEGRISDPEDNLHAQRTARDRME